MEAPVPLSCLRLCPQGLLRAKDGELASAEAQLQEERAELATMQRQLQMREEELISVQERLRSKEAELENTQQDLRCAKTGSLAADRYPLLLCFCIKGTPYPLMTSLHNAMTHAMTLHRSIA